jgi:hypothetical protein
MVEKNEKSRMLRLRDWLESGLKRIGDIRDGFLISAGIFYLFGYLVWSINAYRIKLGLLSALDFQYFIAGIIPVLILVAFVTLALGFIRLRRKVRGTLTADAKGGRLILRRALLIFWGLSFALMMVQASNWFQALFSRTTLTVLATIVIITFSATSLFLPPLEISPRTSVGGVRDAFKSLLQSVKGLVLFESLLGAGFAWLLILAVPTLAFVFFLTRVYPRVPQEFGGTRPRCGYVDVTKAQISSEALKDIVPADGITSSEPVLRSSRVDILFSGSDALMIRAQGKIYQINKSAIQSVVNCD